ncbi:MAG TPA: cobalamin-binding protein [Firmicutes bacterium]|nr:cobalamin-binding protein [Bacillota bacterium]HBL68053.1 cobalamin-binding protein [Bacillota bacterium]HBR23311.1 cobalamin-binding protein [Bacillota bacterium]HCM18194.1 cobalamin-binding protein [Bacillota bacterium]
MNRKNLMTFLLTCAVTITIALAGSGAAGNGVQAAFAYPITMKDDLGRSVTINAQPQRIISLTPSVTEMLFALGVGPRVVGVTNYCNYPAEALAVAKIGDTNLNFERILELQPDLIIGVGSMQAEDINKLISLGQKVFVIEAVKMVDVPRQMRILGRILGNATVGENLAAKFESRVAAVQKKVSQQKARPRVFIEIWNEPLMTAGPNTFMDELIVLAGGSNIAGNSPNPWPQFSMETVIERDPEVIILTCYNKEEALSRKAWAGTSAIKNARVYEVNPDIYSRPAPRLVDALEEMYSLLHP